MYYQVQDLGLAPSYKEKQTTCDFIRQLFALPHEHITPSFKKLRKSATTPRLEKLMRYTNKNWIKSPTFKLENCLIISILLSLFSALYEVCIPYPFPHFLNLSWKHLES